MFCLYFTSSIVFLLGGFKFEVHRLHTCSPREWG